jgi:hypothetical protein
VPGPAPAARPGPSTPSGSGTRPSPPAPAAAAVPAGAAAGPAPTREELTLAWGDRILPSLRPAVKMYVANGRFVTSDGAAAVLAVPDRGLLARAEPHRAEIEAALGQHFGRPVRLQLVIDEAAPPATAGPAIAPTPSGYEADSDDVAEWAEMAEAPEAAVTPEQRLMQAFPGAQEVPDE